MHPKFKQAKSCFCSLPSQSSPRLFVSTTGSIDTLASFFVPAAGTAGPSASSIGQLAGNRCRWLHDRHSRPHDQGAPRPAVLVPARPPLLAAMGLTLLLSRLSRLSVSDCLSPGSQFSLSLWNCPLARLLLRTVFWLPALWLLFWNLSVRSTSSPTVRSLRYSSALLTFWPPPYGLFCRCLQTTSTPEIETTKPSSRIWLKN